MMPEREHFTNGRCFTFGTGLALMGTSFGAQVSGWTHWITLGVGYGIGIVLMSIATMLIAKSYFSRQSEHPNISPSQATGTTPGIPTLSSLLGQNPAITFDVKKHFALAYYSPVTAEIEKNIKAIAEQNYPKDKESFYARFIGVGAVAYLHEATWLGIYRSQLDALNELSSRGLIPVAELRKHYDKAVHDYPNAYKDRSFEQWLKYMQSRFLIARYPSEMVELSFGGKDFLRYVAHAGYKVDVKAN